MCSAPPRRVWLTKTEGDSNAPLSLATDVRQRHVDHRRLRRPRGRRLRGRQLDTRAGRGDPWLLPEEEGQPSPRNRGQEVLEGREGDRLQSAGTTGTAGHPGYLGHTRHTRHTRDSG